MLAHTLANSSFSPTGEVVGPSFTIAATHLGSPSDIKFGGVPPRLVSNRGISQDTPKIKGNKLIGLEANGDAGQGWSVALSANGKTAIVGGPGDDGGKGAVWIYRNVKGEWRQDGSKIVGSDAVGKPKQGSSVFLSANGNTAIVGGFEDDGAKGAVWIFRYINGVWCQDGSKLVDLGIKGDAWQGSAVSLSEDGKIAIVGGPIDDGWIGAVWTYRYVNGLWHLGDSKIVGSDAVGQPKQGSSVSLSANGNTAIVGGFGDDGGKGAVWIYHNVKGVWHQTDSKLVASGAIGEAYQGKSVSLSADGKTAIVGGEGDDDSKGAVWIYRNVKGVWRQVGNKLVGTGAVGDARQGWSVSLSADGKTAIVGGDADDGGMGAIWIYRNENGVWRQDGNKLVGNGAVGAAGQGKSVSLSADGKTAIIGGPYDDGKKGAVWIYKKVNGAWVQY